MTSIPQLSFEADNVRFFISPNDHNHLVLLPWQTPLEHWHDHRVKMVHVKSGLSRHVVRFIASGKRHYAVKETTPESAGREYERYLQLTALDVPTLSPVGIVCRNDGTDVVHTPVGTQVQMMETGYLITELMEKVIPDSFLFKRAFSEESRNRIWDAVIRLFIHMHSRGVYWGDASLANMLVHFSPEVVPELGRRTRLRAVLADAETVEIHPTVSDSLRLADVEFFLESMLWTEADLRASGAVRDPLMTQEDQSYILRHYNELFDVELEMRSFELVTQMDADRLLGNFDVRGYGKLLLQHINEHKWYLSERRNQEVLLVEAAEDWYSQIFKPVCGIFQDHGLLRFFPDKTASSLYVEIMEHKYFMSQREKRDVGLATAVEDYTRRFARSGPLKLTVDSIMEALKTLLTRYSLPGHTIYLA